MPTLNQPPVFDFAKWLETFKSTSTDSYPIWVGSTQLKRMPAANLQDYATRVAFDDWCRGLFYAMTVASKQITYKYTGPDATDPTFSTGLGFKARGVLKDFDIKLEQKYIYVFCEVSNPEVTRLRVYYSVEGAGGPSSISWMNFVTDDNNFIMDGVDDLGAPKHSLPKTGEVPGSNLSYKDFAGVFQGGYNQSWSDFRGSRYSPPNAYQTYHAGFEWRYKAGLPLGNKLVYDTGIGEANIPTVAAINTNGCFKIFFPPEVIEADVYIQLLNPTVGDKIKVQWGAPPILDPTVTTSPTNPPPGGGSTPVTAFNFIPAAYKKATIARDTFAKLAPPSD